jgi:hypothetical protein
MNIKPVLLVLTLLFPLQVFGQSAKESHERYLAIMKEDVLNDQKLQQALLHEKSAFSSLKEFRYAYNIGIVYEMRSNYGNAETWFEQALSLAENNQHVTLAIAALGDVRTQIAKQNTVAWNTDFNVSMILKGGTLEMDSSRIAGLPQVLKKLAEGESIKNRIEPVKHLFNGYDAETRDNILLLTKSHNKSAQQHYKDGVKDFLNWYQKRYFAHLDDLPITIVFFESAWRAQEFVSALYPNNGRTEYHAFLGVFNPKDNLILATVTGGYGTFLHELMHAMVHNDFADVPAWLDEGMAMMYERSMWSKTHLIPLPNWRLNNVPVDYLTDLQSLGSIGESDNLDNRQLSALRMLMLYLESRNQLANFYEHIKVNANLRNFSNALNHLALDPLDWQNYVSNSYRRYQADLNRHSDQLSNPDEIRFIQRALNQLLGTDHDVDGVWGSTTENQVMEFQRLHGLGVDGVVGKKTKKKIKVALSITNNNI